MGFILGGYGGLGNGARAIEEVLGTKIKIGEKSSPTIGRRRRREGSGGGNRDVIRLFRINIWKNKDIKTNIRLLFADKGGVFVGKRRNRGSFWLYFLP